MAYVEKDEVRQELLTLVDESVVTDADLDLWITDAGRLIDARIGRLYALPLPSPLPPQAMILATAAREYVVSRAMRKHFSDRMIGDVDAWMAYARTANLLLDRLVDSDLLSGWVPRPTVGLATIVSAALLDAPSEIDMLLLSFDHAAGRWLSEANLLALAEYHL